MLYRAISAPPNVGIKVGEKIEIFIFPSEEINDMGISYNESFLLTGGYSFQ